MPQPAEQDRVRALTTAPLPDLVTAPAGRLETVLALWTPRRLVLAALLWPLLTALTWLRAPAVGAGGPAAAGTAGLLLLVAGAAAAALSLSTYLPGARQGLAQSVGGACGLAGLLLPLVGLEALRGAVTGADTVLGLSMIALGLGHRVLTAGECGVGGR